MTSCQITLPKNRNKVRWAYLASAVPGLAKGQQRAGCSPIAITLEAATTHAAAYKDIIPANVKDLLVTRPESHDGISWGGPQELYRCAILGSI
jgi:hypothetical protein